MRRERCEDASSSLPPLGFFFSFYFVMNRWMNKRNGWMDLYLFPATKDKTVREGKGSFVVVVARDR